MFLQLTESAGLASTWPTLIEAVAAKNFYMEANAWRLKPLGVWANVSARGSDEEGYYYYIYLIKDGRSYGYLMLDTSQNAKAH